MNGWLLIDKPLQWTSFDVVNKVRSIIARHRGVKPKSIKVGHTGTLDPLASGLLVLAVGKATKQISGLIKDNKTYQATMILGRNSSTGDREGDLQDVSSHQPSIEGIKTVFDKFTGEITQTPPQFSAIKVAGVPAYKRARKGQTVELKARRATIHKLNLLRYEYPEVDFDCQVSSGTYVRTLAEDIGKALKTGSYLGALRRTTVGQYGIDDAIDIADINYDKIKKALRALD